MRELPSARKIGNDGQVTKLNDAMSGNDAAVPVPLSRPVALAGIVRQQRITVTATDEECGAVASLFGLPAIATLSGRFAIIPERRGQFRVHLGLTAAVTQTCVVTLEPVEQSIIEQATLVLMPHDIAVRTEERVDEPDIIPVSGQNTDFGILLTEQLALALDPHPRKRDAELPPAARANAGNPFAILTPPNTNE